MRKPRFILVLILENVRDHTFGSLQSQTPNGYLHCEALTRIIHKLVGWDKATATWWAGACELTFHFDYMLFWVSSPFPPAHHGITHAGPTLRE